MDEERIGKENCKERKEISLLRCWKFQCTRDMNKHNAEGGWVSCEAANHWERRMIKLTESLKNVYEEQKCVKERKKCHSS